MKTSIDIIKSFKPDPWKYLSDCQKNKTSLRLEIISGNPHKVAISTTWNELYFMVDVIEGINRESYQIKEQ